MAKSGSLLIAGVVLIAGVAAWLALSGEPGRNGAPQPASAFGANAGPAVDGDPGRAHVGAGPAEDAPSGTETITHDLVAIAQRGGECTFHIVLPPGTELSEHFSTEHFYRGSRGWGDRRELERPENGKPSFTLFLEEGTHVLRMTLPGPTLAAVTPPGLIGEGPEIVVSGDGPLPDVEIVTVRCQDKNRSVRPTALGSRTS